MSDPTPEVVTIDGAEFYQWKVVLRIPKNWTPESGVFIAVAPPGGIANFPAAVQGAPGLPITIRNSNVVTLDPDDPTDDSFDWTLITPGTATTQPVYDVTLTWHRGADGAPGANAMLDATDLTGTPTAGYVFRVNSSADGVEMVAMRVGNTYWPTSITTLSGASGGNAIATIVVPGQSFPWRPHVNGQDIFTYSGADCQANLVARLGGTGSGDGHTDGLVVARGLALPGSAALSQVVGFAAAPPINSTAGFGQVAAGGSGTNIFIRGEQQGSGTATFSTVSGQGFYSVDVIPVG